MELPLTLADLVAITIVVGATIVAGFALRTAVISRRHRVPPPAIVGNGRLAVLWLDPAAHGVRDEVAERLRDVATLVRAAPGSGDPEDQLRRQRSHYLYN